MHACALAVLLAGCHLVFPIDGGGEGDDGVPPPCTPIGHDEDGDDLDDACDPCPHVSAYDDPDADKDDDRDGVGDGCDPEPGAPNVRLWFDGFGAVTPGDYTMYGGGNADDAFRFEPATIGALTWGAGLGRVVVTAVVEVDAVGAAGVYRELGLLVDARAPDVGAEPIGNYCVVGRNPTEEDYQQVYFRQRPNGDDPITTTLDNSIVIEDVVAVEARYDVGRSPSLTCTFVAFDASTNYISGDTLVPGGGIGIYSMRVGVAYTYLFVVELAPID